VIDQERERIQDDLRGLIDGDVRCDDIFVQLFATDASLHQVRPLGVVRPRTATDVAACARYAADNGIPIHPRGAGTGLAGESLGPGLVVDFSRYMRRVVETQADEVRVQPGVVLHGLNRHLATIGRQFGPDPATAHVTTMGSVISLDAAGSRWLRFGSTRQHVKSLEIALSDGSLFEVGREPIPREISADIVRRRRDLVTGTADLIQRRADVIAAHRPKSLVNHGGYQLDGVVRDDHIDLAKLLVGSDGTLAMITEASLTTQPLAAHRGVVLLSFSRLENAARAVAEIVPLGPSACDLMDRRHLSLAREHDVRYDILVPTEAEAALLVEQQSDDRAEVTHTLREVIARVRDRHKLAFSAYETNDADQVEVVWRLARTYVPTLQRVQGAARPVPIIEDIAVPADVLPEALVALQNVLKEHHVIAALFGHAGQGQLHLRPFLDVNAADHADRLQRLAEDVYEQVWRLGGTVTGEHGDGLSRTPFLRRQYGPLCDVFSDLKKLFDPAGILNPGKIVGRDDPSITARLRPAWIPQKARSQGRDVSARDDAESKGPLAGNGKVLVPLQLAWNQDEMMAMASHCNGCGTCRAQTGEVRMCPVFHFAPSEEASPRAKANLMRGILNGELDAELLARDELKEVADLCIHCHQCRLECPAGVDIPKLMVEAKAAYVAVNGMQPTDWFLSRIDRVSAWAGRMPRLANWALQNPQLRWLLEKLAGVAQGRKLPRLAPRPFLRTAARRRLHRPSHAETLKVLYFVDTYANRFDHELAESVVAVLQHNGVEVYVPGEQQTAGMPLIATGVLDKALDLAEDNVRLLADAVRQGYTIVTSEPSAALCLKHEYLNLLDDDDARMVADRTSDVCQYLWSLHRQRQLRLNLSPIETRLAYHTPCHLKALGIGTPGENLLQLIPKLRIERVEKGCSGMAGIYGLTRRHYRSSLRAGWPLISTLRRLTVDGGTTECSTCKMQMSQGMNKPTIHPIKLLALSYGLMPEVARQLPAGASATPPSAAS